MENNTFNLCVKERRYREKSFVTCYFSPNLANDRHFAPIEIDGYRYKLNLDTGDILPYTYAECLTSTSSSIRRTKVLLHELLSMNDFDWFVTFTFDPERVNKYDDEAVYAAFFKYMDYITRKFPRLGYIAVPERHEDGSLHFHMLLNGISAQELGLVNSGKVCCHWATRKNNICSLEYFNRTKSQYLLKDTDGLPIYNVTNFIYGYTTVTRIVSRERCNSYVTKYLDKAFGSTTIFKKRFMYSKNLNVPEVVTRCVGSGFSYPHSVAYNEDLESMGIYTVLNRKSVNAYNVLQGWVTNQTLDNLHRGLLPLDDTTDLEKAFDSQFELEDYMQKGVR